MMKKLFVGILFSICVFPLLAQDNFVVKSEKKSFNHLDLSVSLSTLGLGVDLATPIGQSVQVRTGFHFIPKFKPTMSFGLGLENDEVTDGISQSRFDEMAEVFTDFTGCEIDDRIDMVGEPTCYNFSFLVDIAPFKDKRWSFTAGVFAGPSQIAKAYNTTEDMPSLFSVNLYNKMYESAYFDKPLLVHGDQVIYLDPEIGDKLLDYGRLSITLGEKADGSGPCRVVPDVQSMVKVKMKVNPVRPYLGFGFGDTFGKKNKNSRYSFTFDAGVLFWGGTPQILTKEFVQPDLEKPGYLVDVDLAKDVVDIRGKAGKYVRFMKSFKVCPMLSFKITRRLF